MEVTVNHVGGELRRISSWRKLIEARRDYLRQIKTISSTTQRLVQGVSAYWSSTIPPDVYRLCLFLYAVYSPADPHYKQ